MNKLVTKNENHIKDIIYEIRGNQVMLDSDLAKLYQCKNGTKEINQAVKNNLKKFSTSVSWILSDDEYEYLRSKFLTSNSTNRGGRRNNPRVFTEEGIQILSTILKSKSNLSINDSIMKVFSKTRKNCSMNNVDLSIENQGKISNMIYEVRGKQVMLDTDLARLYQCKNGTKDVNKAVNRNIQKFPEDFYFQLNRIEYENLKFQNGTSSLKQYGGVRKLPYVFTEQGVAMLATVLKTEVASKISVDIMRAFVLMRKYLSTNLLEQRYFKNMLLKHDEDLKLIHKTLEQLESKKLTNEIYYEGQIYDAYSKLIDIMNRALQELIIIDSYADKSVLDMISKIDKSVILITKERGLLKRIDIEKYNRQYHNLSVIYNNTFHDRYLILDKSAVYHLGTSLNHAGSKTFGVNKLEDKVMIDAFINYVLKIIKSKK